MGSGLYEVQKAGLSSDEWKTVCKSEDKEYAEKIYGRQLQFHSIGRFRLVDPDGNVVREEEAAPLFS